MVNEMDPDTIKSQGCHGSGAGSCAAIALQLNPDSQGSQGVPQGFNLAWESQVWFYRATGAGLRWVRCSRRCSRVGARRPRLAGQKRVELRGRLVLEPGIRCPYRSSVMRRRVSHELLSAFGLTPAAIIRLA